MKAIIDQLHALAQAASAQGSERYDHVEACEVSGLHQLEGDQIHAVAAAWSAALPDGHMRLMEWKKAENPTGHDVAEVFDRAIDMIEGRQINSGVSNLMRLAMAAFLPPDRGIAERVAVEVLNCLREARAPNLPTAEALVEHYMAER